MDYDVIYVDENRNAVSRDHRTQSPTRPGARPSRTVVVPPNARPTVITGSASGYYHPTTYYQPA